MRVSNWRGDGAGRVRRPGRVLVTGGAGYIGSVLARRLLADGINVRVLDAQIFGNGLAGVDDSRLDNVVGDIRDVGRVSSVMAGVEVVVHLAAVANDPSVDLDPELGRSVNADCLNHVFGAAQAAGVRRFIYASSASVYGISDAPDVDEGHPLLPLTDYNRLKALGERLLLAWTGPGFETVAVRAATVCGVSPRQRLDLTVNLLTAQAVVRRAVTVFGGSQYRPNIHIEDLVDVYHRLVVLDALGPLSGQQLNVGNENLTVAEIATMVAHQVEAKVGARVAVTTTATDDTRSYRLTSRRLSTMLGMTPRRTVRQAIDEVAGEILADRLPDPLIDSRYYNVRRMAELGAALRSY